MTMPIMRDLLQEASGIAADSALFPTLSNSEQVEAILTVCEDLVCARGIN